MRGFRIFTMVKILLNQSTWVKPLTGFLEYSEQITKNNYKNDQYMYFHKVYKTTYNWTHPEEHLFDPSVDVFFFFLKKTTFDLMQYSTLRCWVRTRKIILFNCVIWIVCTRWTYNCYFSLHGNVSSKKTKSSVIELDSEKYLPCLTALEEPMILSTVFSKCRFTFLLISWLISCLSWMV